MVFGIYVTINQYELYHVIFRYFQDRGFTNSM